MAENLNDFYQELDTEKLKKILKSLEIAYYNMDYIINDDVSHVDLKEKMEDYEIDISLIRMELNKRLWCDC